ncbi:16S rRNA (cytosine(967)-C(5))-methyltransferase RsmB [Hydrogenophaga sp. PAMC20947]|uniref:16S rRNA (cytosine(967)-C(5))-methyltransferase RsmB n=1 Tax=Hydrogenophaga sp. PAMC20947 TaxID=2565558 RepID=UPI00109DA012|nr:16S rRNA (cytosine(967)-C(5))-methyltransferase RsmB [Hydrogenophaga sp. PAMC20947]QCB47313.1 16S rRNA (cytosine(967)-C(5))-methyltransferase RsmB [Hydrogenophaga sp. PAMC20947]
MNDHRAPGRPAAPPPSGPTLATQIHWTAQCVLAVERGRSLSEVLPGVPGQLRPGVQALTFESLRHAGAARHVARQLAQRAPAPPALALLHTALALLLGDPDGARYAPHTLVDQAVDAAKQTKDTRMQSGFLNACLRRFLRERPALVAGLQNDPMAQWNHPLWWIERVRRDHPEHWQAVLGASQVPGPMVLRVNRRRQSRDAYAATLTELGLASQPVGEDGLLLARPVPVDQLPGFAQGDCSVQDGAAQLAASLLLAGRSWTAQDRILDACAAPGGKTAHLLERSDAHVVGIDVDPQRCERIHDNLRRLGLEQGGRVQVKAADAGRTQDWWDGQLFDGILLDAPCTASGIVRRHPDVRWLRRDSDVAQLVAIQRQLLEALWPLLKPGGRLLYCTCSVFRAEGAEQVQAFLERHTDAIERPGVGHLLPGNTAPMGDFNDNAPSGYDGFYYASIDKAGP